jgi:AraC-like DNA-binding protein
VRTRIDRAVTLLIDSELSIAQISRVVGFRTPSHFSTVFRRFTSATRTGPGISQVTHS